MAFGNGAPRGWPDNSDDNVSANQQPQWIPAGAWEPLSTNTISAAAPLEFTTGDDAAITCLQYNFGTSDSWFFVTAPPVNWTGSKVKFIAHYIVDDEIGTPGTVIWQLGADRYTNNFDLDTISFSTVNLTDTLPDANIPKYRITAESSELTVTGATATEAIQLRLKRGTDTESDPVYFVGLKLLFV